MKKKKYSTPKSVEFILAPDIMVVEGSTPLTVGTADNEEDDPGDPNDARYEVFYTQKSVWDE